MAQIRVRKNNAGQITSYSITVFLGRDNNGKKIQCNKSITPDELKAKTPKAIEKELALLASEYEKEVVLRPLDHSKDTFAQYAEYYLNRKEKTGKQCFTTLQSNRERLTNKINPIIGSLKIADIKPVIITDAIEKIRSGVCDPRPNAGKLSPLSVHDNFRLMHAIFEDARINEVILKNPCEKAKKDLPKIPPSDKLKHWEIDQTKTFLELISREPLIWNAYFNLSLVSACRREELLGLRFRDINYKNGTISITSARVRDENGERGKRYADKDPKSAASRREIPILPEVMEILKKWENVQKKNWFILRADAWQGAQTLPESYVFSSEEGKELSIDAPLRKMKRMISNYNKTVEDPEDKLPPISLHCMRHTVASILENNGLPFSALQEFLGHGKTKSVTGVYTHALKGNDEKIFTILRELYSKDTEDIPQSMGKSI